MKVSDIARALSAEVAGEGELDIERIVHPADATGRTDLAVALTKDTLAALAGCAAGALLVPADGPRPEGTTVLLYSGNDRVAIAILTALFDRAPAHGDGIHPSAVIGSDAAIGANVSIGPHATVGAGSAIGERTVVLANVTIGADVAIGANCVIHPGVIIGDRVTVGDRVRIFPNAVIGGDGFGFIPVRNPDGSPGAEGAPMRIHSLGTVVIGNDVEIGCGTTIDRATLRETRIGNGTKIDNQVQIGHNVVIGESCLIAGMVGIAGSVTIGDRVLLGAACGIVDHVTIGSDSVIGAMAGVSRKLQPGGTAFGLPAVARDRWIERHVNVSRLKALYPRVDGLEARLDALEKGDKPE
jgi:UDP-3-O-[3-hydroxymyristoyl] glucosamine N-acyltransferase